MAKKTTKQVTKKAASTTAKKVTKKSNPQKQKTQVTSAQPPSHEDISERAYHIYLNRVACGKEGCCETDWLQACEELS